MDSKKILFRIDNFLEKEKKRMWLIHLIDDSKVLWNASSGGHVGVVEQILEVVDINLNVVKGSWVSNSSIA